MPGPQTDSHVIIKAPVRTGASIHISRGDVTVVKKQRRVRLTISGTPTYVLDLELHQAIYVSDSTWDIHRGSVVVLKLYKKQQALHWLRLLEDEASPLLPSTYPAACLRSAYRLARSCRFTRGRTYACACARACVRVYARVLMNACACSRGCAGVGIDLLKVVARVQKWARIGNWRHLRPTLR